MASEEVAQPISDALADEEALTPNNEKDDAEADKEGQLAVKTDAAIATQPQTPTANVAKEEPVQYVDERTKVLGRMAELEALRNRNSLQQKKAAFNQCSPLSTSLASFFLQQKQMKQEVRKNRQGALSSLSQFRLKESDGFLAASPRKWKRDNTSCRLGMGMPSAYSTMVDVDNFFRMQKQMDLEWREKKEKTLKKLHMYRQENVHNRNGTDTDESTKVEDNSDPVNVKPALEEGPRDDEQSAVANTPSNSDEEVLSSLLMVHAELVQFFTALSTPEPEFSYGTPNGKTIMHIEEVGEPLTSINNSTEGKERPAGSVPELSPTEHSEDGILDSTQMINLQHPEEEVETNQCCRCEIFDAMQEALLSQNTSKEKIVSQIADAIAPSIILELEEPKVAPAAAERDENAHDESKADTATAANEIEAVLHLPGVAKVDGVLTLEHREEQMEEEAEAAEADIAAKQGGTQGPVVVEDDNAQVAKAEEPLQCNAQELVTGTREYEVEQTEVLDETTVDEAASKETSHENFTADVVDETAMEVQTMQDKDNHETPSGELPNESQITNAEEAPAADVQGDEQVPGSDALVGDIDNPDTTGIDYLANQDTCEEKKEESLGATPVQDTSMHISNAVELLDPFSEARHSFDQSELYGSADSGKKSCPLGLHEDSFMTLEEFVAAAPVSSPTVDSSVSSFGSSVDEGSVRSGRLSRQTSSSSLSSFWKQDLTKDRGFNEALMCNEEQYLPNLHSSKGPCERCLSLASEEEVAKFRASGRNLHIMLCRGGCRRTCSAFPRSEEEPPVRLCRKCYFDTHRAAKVKTTR